MSGVRTTFFMRYTAGLPLHLHPLVECNQFADDTALCSVDQMTLHSVRLHILTQHALIRFNMQSVSLDSG